MSQQGVGRDDGGRVSGEVRKNSREVIRLTRREWEGHDLICARVWVFSEGPGGEARPTRKGLCLR